MMRKKTFEKRDSRSEKLGNEWFCSDVKLESSGLGSV
jgi:hypothetical protein